MSSLFEGWGIGTGTLVVLDVDGWKTHLKVKRRKQLVHQHYIGTHYRENDIYLCHGVELKYCNLNLLFFDARLNVVSYAL